MNMNFVGGLNKIDLITLAINEDKLYLKCLNLMKMTQVKK